MDIRVLKYFLAVAQEENITKAAEILHTAQSNLSRQLADMENEVGKKLFIRGSRKITLTEEGMFLRKRAKEIVELLDRTETDLMNYNEEISGTIHIGAIETDNMRVIAKTMLALKETHSQIQYDFFSGSIAEINEQLSKGILDFAFLLAPIDMDKFNYQKLPLYDRCGVLMRKDHPLAKKKTIQPEDVGDYPIWIAHQQLEENSLSGWLGRDLSSLNIISTFNLITTPSMMIDEGLGMAFTIENLVNTEAESNLHFVPLNPPVKAELYLVWKKYEMFTKAAETFLKHIQQNLFDVS